MLRTRDYDKWLRKQIAREEAMSGWNAQKGYFHNPRRSKKYVSRGKMYARKAFGRHPNANFLKG